MSKPINEYECPDCGANDNSPVDGLCDTCILKFYLQDSTAPALEPKGNKIHTNVTWVADDESYGGGDILIVDTSRWSASDQTMWDEADESDKWELAEDISRKYGHASDSVSDE